MTLSWVDHIKTRSVSHRKKVFCLFVSVFLPGGAASYKLSEGAVCGLASLWCGEAHGPEEHIDSSNMKSYRTWKPRIIAKLWLMTVSTFVPRGGKVRDENDERQREWAEGGKGPTEMLWALMPCQCCMPLPLRFPRDMNEVNEWWTRPTQTPLVYWARAVHSRGWVRRQHQQQQ